MATVFRGRLSARSLAFHARPLTRDGIRLYAKLRMKYHSYLRVLSGKKGGDTNPVFGHHRFIQLGNYARAQSHGYHHTKIY